MQQLHVQPNFNFDAELSQQAQDAGIAITILNNKEFLVRARATAKWLARKGQVICADDVRRETERRGIEPKTSACWGGLFRGREWIFAGWIKSEKISNHSRHIMQWKLV